ncbi:MAG TPA: hypothetical protein VIK40_02455, partial [Geomonas sp.]
MKAKEIWITERAGLVRAAEPVRVSVPCARGELPGGRARLLDPQGQACPVQFEVLSRWHDGSIKWLLCDFTASAPPNGRAVYRLVAAEDELAPGAEDVPPAGIVIVPGPDAWLVDTGAARFRVDARTLRPFAAVTARGAVRLADRGGECLMTLSDGTQFPALVESVLLESRGALRATLCLKGRFLAPAQALFTCRIHFYAERSHTLIELTLLNPAAARHTGGLWDLGDPRSLLFRELAVNLSWPEQLCPELCLVAEPGTPRIRPVAGGAKLSVRQESSGGGRRLSPNHRTADGNCSASAAGYLVQSGERVLKQGERATPTFWCGFGASGIGVVLPHFWQEFPKEIAASRRALKIALFPAGAAALHELQGGEQKTTVLGIDFAAPWDGCDWMRAPLSAVAAPQAFREAGVVPDLPALPSEGADLVDAFLASPGELVARREVIDEYGWRHFGEIYADHEAVYHRGEEPFISHYNNQYDICAGLCRKFLATGEPVWGELARDLAWHVLDIDIYHTQQDREEYNGGLFWHTDHYISAGLATHRSFSRVHLDVKDPRFYGGGPAAEHCYTTGLLLHYWLTGNPEFREAVIDLADWSYRSLVGARTVLSVLKRSLGYLSLLRHAGGGLFPRYPLTRGTGNALTAALDAFQAAGDGKFLARAEELIRGALHPGDDIEARNLLEPELAWSYSVLLAAVAKFLDLKRELGELDDGYAFARESLLAYARWMVSHEYPYLQRPEKLQYPNETWAAQELRKCAVLHHAARYAESAAREDFLGKARELLTAATADLDRFTTSRCTRPLALMLQNGWVAQALAGATPGATPPAPVLCAPGAPTPRLGLRSVSLRILVELGLA